MEANLLSSHGGGGGGGCRSVPVSPPISAPDNNITHATNTLIAATGQLSLSGGTGPLLNNGTKDFNDVEKLQQQLQDIKDQVRVERAGGL
jgi:hypothetical protein